MKVSARQVASDPFKPKIGRITSWDDVSGLVEHFSYHRDVSWLFRGVSSTDHDLVPLVGRSDWRELRYSKKDELAVFAMFKNTAVAFLEQIPASEMEWLAVARHYGVPTRFLDWSDRFLVAVWFAAYSFLEVGGRHAEPGVWVVWNLKSVTEGDLDHPFAVKSPRVYRPPHIVPRFSAQGSVLSIHGDPTRPLDVKNRLLLPLDPDACFDLMKRLDDCGLNFATVYPGVDGLGTYLRWRYRNGWLAGY